MMRYLALIFCFVSTFCSAQQNLFNIPSGDITPKGKFFYQHQINAYDISSYESKSHLVYGLIDHVDIGVNVVNLPIELDNGVRFIQNDNQEILPLYPAVLFTSQYKKQLHNSWSLNVGALYGFNIPSSIERTRFLYKVYGLLNFETQGEHKLKLLAGPYYANENLVGANSNVGLLAGYEYVLSHKIYLMGDYISGNNTSSSVVIGVNYNLTSKIQLCTGALLATPNDELKPGIVFELNLLGYDLLH